jgi:Phosphatidylserine/phosphatidylglycerophosphate/cardiolipin synthases and related enzymes
LEAFTHNIEQIILERFERAKKTIVIVVAWFTNPRIVAKLIELKRYRKLTIQILVDDNEINKKYFFQLYQSDLEEVGIDIKQQHTSKFNHNKFAVIDNEIVITGSYNYTNKANQNYENIVVEHDERIADYYFRMFKFFSDKNYRDRNIKILLENFTVANQLISSYYPFSPKLFSQVKDKINLGYCFTHENGLFNEISYEAGLIFNPKYKLHRKLNETIGQNKSAVLSPFFNWDLLQEFDLPISKDLIKNFKVHEINNFNYQTSLEIANFNNSEIDFDELAASFEEVEAALTDFYTRKFNAMYTLEELRGIFNRGFDIIIEDYIWINNFAPFLNDTIVGEIYNANSNGEVIT